MEFKGTKGTWRVINGWDKEGNGKFFPSVVLHGPDDDKQYGRNIIVINVSHDQRPESIMANALLISKAPEMLEMLNSIIKLFYKEYSEDSIGGVKLKKAKQLIKEATEL
jgi:hypothetical protein